MFSNRVSSQLKEAINTKLGLELTDDDISQMRVVRDRGRCSKGIIMCLQNGNQTILVGVKISGGDGTHHALVDRGGNHLVAYYEGPAEALITPAEEVLGADTGNGRGHGTH